MENIKAEYLYLTTTRCNCRCIHCKPSVYTGKPGELLAEDMISQYENSIYLQDRPISIAGGEPFLKEDIIEFVKYLEKKNIPTVISTNGFFTERIEALLNALEGRGCIRFAVSIDGIGSVHDGIRRCEGIFDKAVQSIMLIKERGYKVQVNTVIQKSNVNNLREFDQFFSEKGIEVVYIPEIFVNEESFNFSKEDIKEILKYANYPRAKKYLLSKGKWVISNCHAGISSWLIDSNGDVYACCGGYYKDDADEYLLGNLKEIGLDGVLDSEQAKQVYKNKVMRCEGCLLPRDAERENILFGLSTRLTYEEVDCLKEELSSVSLLNDYSIAEEDWYDIEEYQGENFRWMKGVAAYVYVQSSKRKLKKIRIRTLCLEECGNEISLQLFHMDLGKVEVGRIHCDAGLNEYEVLLPKVRNTTGLFRIGIEADHLWTPVELDGNSTDTRKLGIGVARVEMI